MKGSQGRECLYQRLLSYTLTDTWSIILNPHYASKLLGELVKNLNSWIPPQKVWLSRLYVAVNLIFCQHLVWFSSWSKKLTEIWPWMCYSSTQCPLIILWKERWNTRPGLGCSGPASFLHSPPLCRCISCSNHRDQSPWQHMLNAFLLVLSLWLKHLSL